MNIDFCDGAMHHGHTADSSMGSIIHIKVKSGKSEKELKGLFRAEADCIRYKTEALTLDTAPGPGW